jgi:hypothetical protein
MWLEPLRELDPEKDPREALGHYIEQKLAYSRSHAPAVKLRIFTTQPSGPLQEFLQLVWD